MSKPRQHNAFAGRRIRQDSAKLKQLKKREKRLNKIGLSVISFPMQPGEFAQWERGRRELRETKSAIRNPRSQIEKEAA